MPSRSSASAFDRLAPDQRAAVELVLRQGRSYGELAEMLGMPEDTIRARARNGLTGLAPDQLPPTRAGEIADWLLGQQSEAHGARTRALLLSRSDAARAGRRRSPSRCARPRAASPCPRSRPRPTRPASTRVSGSSAARRGRGRDGARDARVRAATAATPTARPRAATPRGRRAPAPGDAGDPAASSGGSSRLGGALLIGAAVDARRGRARVRLHARRRRRRTRPPRRRSRRDRHRDARGLGQRHPPQGPGGLEGGRADAALPGQRRDRAVRDRRAGRRAQPAGETYSLWFRKSDGGGAAARRRQGPGGREGRAARRPARATTTSTSSRSGSPRTTRSS